MEEALSLRLQHAVHEPGVLDHETACDSGPETSLDSEPEINNDAGTGNFDSPSSPQHRDLLMMPQTPGESAQGPDSTQDTECKAGGSVEAPTLLVGGNPLLRLDSPLKELGRTTDPQLKIEKFCSDLAVSSRQPPAVLKYLLTFSASKLV